MVVHVLLLALLGQLTCATHSGLNMPKRNSKKSFLEDAMKAMDGIESLTKPQRIPPRVIKVLIGPEHPHFRHHRHRHRHHHHFYNRKGHFSFPPRPTKPHIGTVKGRDHGQNRTSKLIHDAAFLKQAVRLLVEIKKKLNRSSVKKAKETHLKRNKTSERPELAPTEYSISMLPEIRSIVQRDRDNTGQARAAFAKARQIIDKTHPFVHPVAPSITERVRNDTNITKEAKISSAVAALEDAVQKASQFHTANAVQGAGTTEKMNAPGGQNQRAKDPNTDKMKAPAEGQSQRAKSLNTTVNQRTLLSVLENIKRNLTHREGDFDAKFGRVISHLRTLSNSISNASRNATTPTKEVLTGKPKESAGLSPNKTMLEIKGNQSGSVLKESVSKNRSNSNNKTGTVLEQYTETLKKILQHRNVGSNHSNGLLRQNGSVFKDNNNNSNNNNNRNTAFENLNKSLAKVLQHTSVASNQGTRPVPQDGSVVKDNNRSTALEHLAKSLTTIIQHRSAASNHSNATTQHARNHKVVTGEAKYLLASGQENHTTGAKLPKQRLASRKAFGLAMKLVKAAIAREELRKAEQELFSKMKQMMNKTAETTNANQGSIQPEKSPQDMSNPSADSDKNNNPVSTGNAPNAAASKAKNKKQDSESQEKYNEAAHLEEKIAAQQDKMYDDLVNHILENDDGDEDEEGTVRDLSREQNEDYGDFKDSDEEMNERAYDSKMADTSRYTLRDVVFKPKGALSSSKEMNERAYGPKMAVTSRYTLRDVVLKPKGVLSSSAQGRGGEDKINNTTNTKKSKRPGTIKKRHRGKNHETEASADYGTIHIHENKPQNSKKRNYHPPVSKQQEREQKSGRRKSIQQKSKSARKISKSNT